MAKELAVFLTDELSNLSPINLERLKRYDVYVNQFISLNLPKGIIKSLMNRQKNQRRRVVE